jgi:phosphoheptose isomerase
MSLDIIPGFESFTHKFNSILLSNEWFQAQQNFNEAKLILTAGNGGNLAVCDHGAIDIARLTNKQAMAPGSGILASSLINDASHDLWVKNWLSITTRGHSPDFLSKMMLIGVSSSGYSTNICNALDLALEKGMKALLISATKPHIPGSYNTIILDVDQYHTSEVLTLALFYQLIHGAGFACPTISDSTTRKVVSDYTR